MLVLKDSVCRTLHAQQRGRLVVVGIEGCDRIGSTGGVSSHVALEVVMIGAALLKPLLLRYEMAGRGCGADAVVEIDACASEEVVHYDG